MSISRAFSYAFDQPEWPLKLFVTALLTFLAIILMPVLFAGLIPLAILLSYTLDIINNVRDAHQPLLPAWEDYLGHLSRGAKILPALFVYNLPLVLMSCCLWIVNASFGNNLVEGFATLAVICCFLPILLLYVGVSWPMMAVGMAKYARSGDTGVFFQFSRLFDAVTAIGSRSVQYFLAALITSLILMLINILPLLGQAAFCAIAFPAQAHLMGQYARLVDKHDPHRKRK